VVRPISPPPLAELAVWRDVDLAGGQDQLRRGTHISGRSHGYLFNLVHQGRLSRDGDGRPGHSRRVYLSRSEVEALAVAEGKSGHLTDYWLTVSEAAKVLRVTGQIVRTRLPNFRVSRRLLLVRW